MNTTDQLITDKFALYCGDCCEVLPKFPTESMDLSVYSPPFSDLYNYSSSDRDMSNNASYKDFLKHYEYLVREILRLTKPGRLIAVHCMDLRHGRGLRDFPGDIIRMHQKHGLIYQSRHVVWKEPLKVAIRTRSLGLMHKQIVKDSSLCHVASPDYVLAFRKRGVNEEPVRHPLGLSEYAGFRQPPVHLIRKYANWPDPKTNKLSHWIWQRYASSVWDDVRNEHYLPYKGAKDPDDEKHVCPFALDTVVRCLTLWSNPGDVVLDPFCGIGSTVYCAVRNGRRAIGVELKPSYFRQARRNLHSLTNGSTKL